MYDIIGSELILGLFFIISLRVDNYNMLKLGIVDVMNLVKRNIYVNTNNISDIDESTLIDSILTNIINKLKFTIFDLSLDCVFLVNDNGVNKRAKAIYSEYKANRNKNKTLTDEEKEQSIISYIVETLKTLPFPYLEIRNTEADTIIYHLVKRFNDNLDEYKCYILSSDSDMYQMINNNVVCYDMYSKKEINNNNWINKLLKLDEDSNIDNLNIKDYVLMKSIVGDSSDNIKGVKGLGWKRVIKALSTFRKYNNEEFENHYFLSKKIKEIIDELVVEDKKDVELLTKFYILLNENEIILTRNMKLMDLSQLETSTLFEIVKIIDTIFNKKYKFNEKDFMEFMRFDRWFYDDVEIDNELHKNHLKYLKNFEVYSKRINKTIQLLKDWL